MGRQKQIIFESAFTSYRQLDNIGEGGSGIVVKAEDENGISFAIKFLRPENMSTEKIKRFKNELEFCTQNDHPHVVKVKDWGKVEVRDKKCPFYVMPHYPENLRQLLEKGISPSKVLPLFAHILDGTEAAHLMGVFHRDLKPENILIDSGQKLLVVADFGIAHFAEPLMRTIIETKASDRLANFQYAAPEQREKGAIVDHRADIYALGLMLNEMFTSKIPQGVKFKRISDENPEYAYLDDLVDYMMTQDAEKRPDTIGEIKRELIARGEYFVSEQKLSQLKKKVIPKTEISDHLVDSPPEIMDVRWENDTLTFELSQAVNGEWAKRFHNPGGHSSVTGLGPERFKVHGNLAEIAPVKDESVAQRIIEHTKKYVQQANHLYQGHVKEIAHADKKNQENALRKQIEMAEKTRAINAALKL